MTSANPSHLPLKAHIEDSTMDVVTDVVFTAGEDGIITVGEDKSIRIWLKRETGQYWPSVCHFLLFPCSVACFSSESKILFVGQDNGEIQEFSVSEDFNRLTLVKKYHVHQSKVTGCAYSYQTQILVACGRDSKVSWHYVQNGQRLGEYVSTSPFTCLQYDTQSHYVFAGMNNSEIVVLKISKDNFLVVTTLKGHQGEITCLCWDSTRQVLYSGSADNAINLWDIGGKKGTKIQLLGHVQRITSIFYSNKVAQLYSTSRDGSLVVWNMHAKRLEVPAWQDTDHCMKCNQPFFWNLKQMWSRKTLGQRRHHCRKCGAAVCITCAPDMISLPRYGFEREARVCNQCIKSVTAEDRKSTAQFFDLKHTVINARPDWSRGWYVTCGTDRTVRIWNIDHLFK